MRYAFVNEISKLAQNNKDIILLTGDLGFTVFEDFQKKFPKQFFNVGIAESHMMGMAAGLALSGKIVFAYSIATFATYRPFEFIRNDICKHNASVIIVGSGAGLSYADAGSTHYSTEDIAIMRTLPNMTILCPADPIEAVWATKISSQLKSPVYLRLGKHGESNLYSKTPALKIGKGSQLEKGNAYTILATGNIVANALEASRILKNIGLPGSVYSLHTIKPIDKNLIKNIAATQKYLITIEEHSKIGGLGSAVAETLVQNTKKNIKLLSIALPDAFPHKYGNHKYLRESFNLSPKKIALAIKRFINQKHD